MAKDYKYVDLSDAKVFLEEIKKLIPSIENLLTKDEAKGEFADKESVEAITDSLNDLTAKVTALEGDTVKWVTNDDYLFALVDGEDTLLLGITKDAKLYIPVGLPDGIVGFAELLGKYAVASDYYTREEIDKIVAEMASGGVIDLTSYLTKKEAEETYQEKLEGYTEEESEHESGALDITIDTKSVDSDGGGGGLLTLNAGNLVINSRSSTTGSGIEVNLSGGGSFRVNEGQGFYYKESNVLTRSDVQDSLTSEFEDRPLSANQGRVLNEKMGDFLTKSDVMTNTDVAMLSRMFALPLSSYEGGGLYKPSTDVIGKYTEMFNSLADGELVVCEYQGVKGLYAYQGSTQLYCFTQYIADLNNLPTGVEDSLTSSSKTMALSAKQGKVLDEGKQDKLKYYEEWDMYPGVEINALNSTGEDGVVYKMTYNPTVKSEQHLYWEIKEQGASLVTLEVSEDGIYYNGKSLDAVNHIWMCAGKDDPGDRANLVPADGTPSVGDCILWMTLDANLCASTIQPLHVTSVSQDGKTIASAPYTSWI